MKSDYVLNDFGGKPSYTKEEQKAHRVAWVKALRSGEFKQAREQLKARNGGLCCLGVACEVAGVTPRYNSESKMYEYYGNEATLPRPIQDYYGLKSADGEFSVHVGLTYPSLIQLNDELKYDFNQIADIIESEPEGLLKND